RAQATSHDNEPGIRDARRGRSVLGWHAPALHRLQREHATRRSRGIPAAVDLVAPPGAGDDGPQGFRLTRPARCYYPGPLLDSACGKPPHSTFTLHVADDRTGAILHNRTGITEPAPYFITEPALY